MTLTRVNMIRIAVSFFCLMFLLIGGTTASSFIFVNNSTGPVADYTSIQQAIDNASNEDVIILHPGIYHENIDVDKQISIRSVGNQNDTIIIAKNQTDNVFYVNSDNVSIEGLTIEGATSAIWENRIAGIFLDSSDNCNITNNRLTGNYEGVILHESNNNIIKTNKIFKNINGNGISLHNSDLNTLNSNIINSNWWSGIYLSSSDFNEISGNQIKSNLEGINLYRSKNNKLNNNIANSNGLYGIVLDTDSNNNELNMNTANLNKNSGIYLKYSSSNTMADNVADSNYYQGILMKFSSGNKIINNSASENMPESSSDEDSVSTFGIYLTNCDENEIIGNLLYLNKDVGIGIQESSQNYINGNILLSTSTGLSVSYSNGNLIYDNYFHNPVNVDFTGLNFGNQWNTSLKEEVNILNGDFRGGNFWSDPYCKGYSQLCEDLDLNGICDLPYQINDENTDFLPLYDPTTSWKGDYDYDEDVDFDDFVEFAACYNSMIGQNNYQRIFDFEGDCDVDFDDFVEFAGNYQK
ncbi:parallel beta-helix repeat (two copies) [Methanolobus vulcani]|uniref:Parallel beta-helix repeat (Two copies) n=1 Tax=Methanolobus vulcani TaxID=38026 RepID=A0A7Z7AU47_9EURY|nr:NosD domain-containing protein [Methanolobus vulcani]SDF22690.1 parallel beta-helix repeat (two copies) [Methanolobus vulcani]